MWESIVRHVVIVQQISLQGRHELIGTSLSQTNAVVDAGVVYQRVDSAESLHRLCNRSLTIFGNGKLGRQKVRRDTLAAQLGLKPLSCLGVPVQNHRDGTFFPERACDGSADPAGASGNNYDFLPQLQVQERQAPGPKRTL